MLKKLMNDNNSDNIQKISLFIKCILIHIVPGIYHISVLLTYRVHATKCMFFSHLSPDMSALPLCKVIGNKLLVTICYLLHVDIELLQFQDKCISV